MPAVLIEMGRIASSTIDTRAEIEALAVVCADGILGYLGIKPPTTQPKPEPEEPDPIEWRHPEAVKRLRATDPQVYTSSTQPRVDIGTDRLAAFLDRHIRSSVPLVRINGQNTVWHLVGGYRAKVQSPGQAKVLVRAMGGDASQWQKYVRPISEADLRIFAVLESGSSGGGLTEPQVDSKVQAAIEKHASNPDAHHA